MQIGVLALQGDFEEHTVVLRRLGVRTVEVRLPGHLEGLDGLILPGGESTTMGKLARDFDLIAPLQELSRCVAMWGTCGGLVFMARDVGMEQPVLGIMDIAVQRNAFGRQVDSFEADLDIRGIEGGLFHAVFIRAPVVKSVGAGTQILSKLPDGRIVAVRQDRLMATSFHPEIGGDDRMHEYFLKLARER